MQYALLKILLSFTGAFYPSGDFSEDFNTSFWHDGYTAQCFTTIDISLPERDEDYYYFTFEQFSGFNNFSDNFSYWLISNISIPLNGNKLYSIQTVPLWLFKLF